MEKDRETREANIGLLKLPITLKRLLKIIDCEIDMRLRRMSMKSTVLFALCSPFSVPRRFEMDFFPIYVDVHVYQHPCPPM